MMMMMRQTLLALLLATAVSAQTVQWRSDLGRSNTKHYDQLHVSDDYVFVQGGRSLLSLEPDSGKPHIGVLAPASSSTPVNDGAINGAAAVTTSNLLAYEKRSTTHYLLSYSQESGDVMAYDTRFNELLWTLYKIVAPPVVDREYGVGVFVLTHNGQLMAVDSQSRFPVFAINHNMPTIDESSTTTKTTLHISLDSEKLYILTSDGQVQVHSALDGSLLAAPYFSDKKAAFIVGDFLYLQDEDDAVSAYSLVVDDDGHDETPLWKAPLELDGTLVRVTPMSDDKHVLLLTSTGRLHKIKHWNGKLKWTADNTDGMKIVSMTTPSSSSSSLDSNDDVYAIVELLDQPTYVINLDGKTGETLWTHVEQGQVIVGDVSVKNDAIYILTSSNDDSSTFQLHSQQQHVIKLSTTTNALQNAVTK